MRFSVIVAGLFAAAVGAQSDSSSTAGVTTTTDLASSATDASSTNTDVASSTSNIDPPEDSAQAAMLACLNACDAADVNCQAKCIAVPSPDAQDANSTTTCAAACPQGNGTAADNLAFADCVNDCIGQYYFTTSGTPNTASTTSGSSGSTGAVTPSVTAVESTVTSDGSTFVTSFSSTIAPSGSGSADSAASTSSSSAGADMLFSPVGSGIGLFSFLAAFLAL
ncbi:hypothetical protein F4820DRAFT_407084 [Hypoxylon rubiginosum]|uniref:Uncharacterized protein n=1 Tax=Hypoxylon rubiginosum TaxID=110542 RepID=A0ACB9ZC55_9PEZI|nr:hypothetical protein F4820DRAFT_407084 [Hypoxylon rubiginosum]